MGAARENVIIANAASKSIAAESVIIRRGDCMLTILPGLGGKISSLLVGGRELLQAPLRPQAERTPTMAFDEGDASGWDECLPSVAGCSVAVDAGKGGVGSEVGKGGTGEAGETRLVAVPDHGDLWRVPWQVLESSEDSVTMRGRCFSLPLEMTRSLILSEVANGWELRLLYSVANIGDFGVPWAWSAHPCFAVEAGDRIVLPEAIQSLRLEGSGVDRLGVHGDRVAWPMAKLAVGSNLGDGTVTDLRQVLGVESGVGDKLFAEPSSRGRRVVRS